MPEIIEIQTDRLIMRQWNKEDYSAFAEMNADQDVMEFYPDILTIEQSNAMAQKIESEILVKGWGFWAVELKNNKSFIGFVGLHEPGYKLPMSPCIEIGWRLAKEYWGNGYATEAGKAALDTAFKKLKLAEVYSFASVSNKKSQAVMERINMINTNNNFEHPIIPKNNPLREHVLYKIDRQHWLNNCI
jgi:RimJ/RimL family protein N-acetyltransferase